MDDEIFKKIETKTNVKKENILSLAKKLQIEGFKNKNTLKEVISELSSLTGKEVSKEKEEKIIKMICEDRVPKDVDKYI